MLGKAFGLVGGNVDGLAGAALSELVTTLTFTNDMTVDEELEDRPSALTRTLIRMIPRIAATARIFWERDQPCVTGRIPFSHRCQSRRPPSPLSPLPP